jgi:hypothetical protein
VTLQDVKVSGGISLGNLLSAGTTLIAVVAAFIWAQADIRALQAALASAFSIRASALTTAA